MRLFPAVLLLAAAVACGDSGVAPGDLTEFAGNYALRTINANVLPFTVLTTADVKLDITSDTIYLSSNGSFRDVTHYRRTTLGVVDLPADTLAGDWSVRGQTVTMKTSKGQFQGNVSGNALSIDGTGVTSVYVR